jgi:hypothetical protein
MGTKCSMLASISDECPPGGRLKLDEVSSFSEERYKAAAGTGYFTTH